MPDFHDTEQRLQAIEQRLERLEQAMLARPAPVWAEPDDIFDIDEVGAEMVTAEPSLSHAPRTQSDTHSRTLAIGSLLGWSGATALVVAMAYLIRLAIDEGWLTPARQIAIAVAFGVVLIACGLLLRNRDRVYAGYLPAGGIIVLFLSVYGAHLFYPLIPASFAMFLVMGISIISLWLCKVFDSDIYAFFAVVGSYTVPFLFPQLRGAPIDLVIYFSVWSVLFSTFSVIIGRRAVLLLSLYLALIFFDLIWRTNAVSEPWLYALMFQCVQLLTFAVATLAFAVVRHDPMRIDTAYLYLPALLIFYALQYALLQAHLPDYAPWIASGSALLLLAVYVIARLLLKREVPGGQFLVGAYLALVLFHAGYLESLPEQWQSWAGLVAAPLAMLFLKLTQGPMQSRWPVPLAFAVIFLISFVQVISNIEHPVTFTNTALYVLYPLELYAAYFFSRRFAALGVFCMPLLYAGHVSTLCAVAYLIDTRLAVSMLWGMVALTTLVLALEFRDRALGQSSLFIFAIAGAKVLFYDLADATPLIRIACLIALGLSFYAGGWMYRKLDFQPEPAK